MIFKKNYFDELPDEIRDKIYLLVNKCMFNICLKDLDNPKIKLFHKFNKFITDNLFYLTYSVRDLDKLGWFWKNHKNPMDDDEFIDDDDEYFAMYDLFDRDKRLSYKEYIKVLPEYTNLKYYRFKYTDTKEFRAWEIPNINSFVKMYFIFNNYVIEKTNIIIKRLTFKKNYIHIYIKKISYQDNSPLDIAYNISFLYNAIIDCVIFLNNNHFLSFANTINYLETNSYLESFQIFDKVITTFFTD
jgi:hypothetical protein